jgi:hypothetical protein
MPETNSAPIAPPAASPAASPAAAFSGIATAYAPPQPVAPPPASNANEAPPPNAPGEAETTSDVTKILSEEERLYLADLAARVADIEFAQAHASDPRAGLLPEEVLGAVIGPDAARLALDALELHLRRTVIAPGLLGTVAFDGRDFVFLAVPVVAPEDANA